MILKKLNELIFFNNDIYILEKIANIIVINDNQSGLIFLTFALEKKAYTAISESFFIYGTYKQYNDTHLLFYSPDTYAMIFVDTQHFHYSIITLDVQFDNDIFSPVYYWDKSTLIVCTFSGDFYTYAVEKNVFIHESISAIATFNPVFYDFYQTCQKYIIAKVYSDQDAFIFEQGNGVMGYFDMKKKNEILISDMASGWHDIEYMDETFILVYENRLEIVLGGKKIILEPENQSYCFLKVQFLAFDIIAVLSSNKSNQRNSVITTYQIYNNH